VTINNPVKRTYSRRPSTPRPSAPRYQPPPPPNMIVERPTYNVPRPPTTPPVFAPVPVAVETQPIPLVQNQDTLTTNSLISTYNPRSNQKNLDAQMRLRQSNLTTQNEISTDVLPNPEDIFMRPDETTDLNRLMRKDELTTQRVISSNIEPKQTTTQATSTNFQKVRIIPPPLMTHVVSLEPEQQETFQPQQEPIKKN